MGPHDGLFLWGVRSIRLVRELPEPEWGSVAVELASLFNECLMVRNQESGRT